MFRHRTLIFCTVAAAAMVLVARQGSVLRDERQAYLERRVQKAEFGALARSWDHMRFRDPSTDEIPLTVKADEASLAASFTLTTSAAQSASSVTWVSRGPFDVGGRTRDIAVDVSDEQVLLAASVTGGIWRSSDQGESWTPVLRPEQLHTVVSLAQDTRPGWTHVWYAGTGERIGSGHGVGNGIYKSVDGGLTWELLPSTTGRPEFAFVTAVATDPTNTTQPEVYAATDEGVYRSTNGGLTWSLVLPGALGVSLDVAANGAVYAGYGFGRGASIDAALFRSPDGLTWTRITPAGWPTITPDLRIAASPSNPNEVHFFTEHEFACRLWKYTYLSGNGSGAGGIWRDRSAELPWYLGTFSGYCMALAIRPDDAEGVFVGGQLLTRYSPNAGLILGIGSPAPHPDTHALAFLPSNPAVTFVATDGGVYRAENGLFQFRPLNSGYVTTQFYGAGLNPRAIGDDAIVGGTQDNWSYYAASGDSARTVLGSTYGSDGGFATILPDGNHILVETHGGSVVRRNIHTGAEQQVNPFLATGSILFINPYVVDPVSGWTMYYPAGGWLWRTLDVRNPNWTRLDGTQVSEWAISALAVSTAAPAHRVYYGNTLGQIVRVDDATGPNPVAIDITPSGGATINSYVSSISVDPEHGDRVLVTVSNYNVKSIFWSGDAGATWQEVGGNLDAATGQTPGFQGPAVLASAILPRPDGSRLYFAGTSMGLFTTTSLQGASTMWTPESPDVIGNMEVNQVAVRAADGFVVVATHGAGMYSAFYGPALVSVGDGPSVAGARLGQAFPNPFRGTTTIPFSLAAPSRVHLSVHDAAGRRIASLADGEFGAGNHAIRWQEGGVPPGIYYYILRVGTEERSGRVVVTK